MLTCAAGIGSIEIFAFGGPQHDLIAGAPVIHVASLQLPPLRANAHLISLGTHTGPFVARIPEGKPFASANEERIHVVSMQYTQQQGFDVPGTRPRFCMFFKNSTAMKYIHEHHEKGGEAPIVEPWDRWGPFKARLLPHRVPFQWLR